MIGRVGSGLATIPAKSMLVTSPSDDRDRPSSVFDRAERTTDDGDGGWMMLG